MGNIVSDFKNSSGKWVMSYGTSGVDKVLTQSYTKWRAMMGRCKVDSVVQKRQPTYIGCSVSEEFKDFQAFTDWYTQQIGYEQQDYHLDKDILLQGNKVYSRFTCVLIPKALNNFLNTSAATRGNYPQGVSYHKTNRRFAANLSVDGVQTFVGYYSTPEEAAKAYKCAKEVEAKRWCNRFKAGEFVIDERVVKRLQHWKHVCDWVAP